MDQFFERSSSVFVCLGSFLLFVVRWLKEWLLGHSERILASLRNEYKPIPVIQMSNKKVISDEEVERIVDLSTYDHMSSKKTKKNLFN